LRSDGSNPIEACPSPRRRLAASRKQGGPNLSTLGIEHGHSCRPRDDSQRSSFDDGIPELAGEDLQSAFGDEAVEDVEESGAVVRAEFADAGEALA
jgi:hypothetical protein